MRLLIEEANGKISVDFEGSVRELVVNIVTVMTQSAIVEEAILLSAETFKEHSKKIKQIAEENFETITNKTEKL